MKLKYFPKVGIGDKVMDIIDILDSIEPRLGDINSIGPMMSKPLRASLYAFIKFIERNLNEYTYFTISKLLSKEVIKSLQEILNNEPSAPGIITYGGSESNLTALYVMRELGYNTVITPRNVHKSIIKAAKVLRLRTVVTGVDKDNRASITDIVRATREIMKAGKQVFVVLTAGNTETGVIDDAKHLYDELPDIEVVVDAAFGGLITPFLDNLELPIYDFRVPSVKCIGVDGHKMGLTPIPSGALLFRNNEYILPITYDAKYFLKQNKQYSLLWTRTSASAAALWASINYLGYEGFSNIVSNLLKLTYYLYEELLSLGCTAIKPELPIICFSLGSKKLNSKAIEYLFSRGWHLYRCPFINGLKVTLMPHINKWILQDFIDDIRRFLLKFK